MKKYFFVAVYFFSLCSIFTQTWQDTTAKVEQIFARYTADNPGCMLAISRNDAVIYSKAWGMADLEHNIQLTTYSPSEAGSVSKQFVAASILHLVQQGKLSIQDDIRKYFPEYRDYGRPITIDHLLRHTSGLKDWGALFSLTGWERQTKTYSNEDAAHIVSLQQSLNFLPGDEYSYSNSNYILLALLVQKISGISLEDYTKKYIFEPAGMKNTQWRSNFKKIVPNRAMAYSKVKEEYFTDMPNEYVYGAGGLLTTAEDLLAWNSYYLQGKMSDVHLLEMQKRTVPLNNGRLNNYAAGIVVDSTNGWPAISHTGATASYRCFLYQFPVQNISIAFLSNTSEFDRMPFNLSKAVIDIWIPNISANISKTKMVPYSMNSNNKMALAGWYRSERDGSGLQIKQDKDGKLKTQNTTLIPISETSLGSDSGAKWEMTKSKKLRYITPSLDSIYFVKVDSSVTTEKILKQYIGDYYSSEVLASCEINWKGGKLVYSQRPRKDMILTPTYKDGFDMDFGTLYFKRDKQGKILSFSISIGRARNVVFKKIK